MKIPIKTLAAAIILTGVATTASAKSMEEQRRNSACAPDEQAAASARLVALREADQAARRPGLLDFSRDEERRVEVAAIFARGCMRTAEDFFSAALVFQHGETPEHYYQAYLWAKRADELGHERGRWLISRAIDRYLMNKGQKQLFATNAVTPAFYGDADGGDYWCVWPSEEGVSNELRARFGARSKQETVEWISKMNAGKNIVRENVECDVDAAPTPKGSFPGIW